MCAKKFVYAFKEGDASQRDLLGGKGANLAEMTNIGLPVPQGITITTEACIDYYKTGCEIDKEIVDQIYQKLAELEQITGKKFGGTDNPLLVSVRSGAKISMPGMLDTILNLGLNDVTVEALAKKTGNERFAYDSYRRFIQMFCDVALGMNRNLFEDILESRKKQQGYKYDTELTAFDLKQIVKQYKDLFLDQKGYKFPDDPREQLMAAVEAIFKSWNNPRAIAYRKLNDIPNRIGTAVNVQSMVYGNMGQTSGTGVAFTRNPATGENKIFGEFLMNAQGEDVVAGIRTPQHIETLNDVMPEVYEQFVNACNLLENHYLDMQDIEFTIEEGKLYFLQTRSGKRTAQASLKVAVDMEEEGLITKEEALLRLDPTTLNQLLHRGFDPEELAKAIPLTNGLPASPGAGCGKIYFSAEDAVEAKERGEEVLLVRKETSPEDIEGMNSANGILTATGGMTSHAAVVARGMGKCCVAGCEAAHVNEEEKYVEIGGRLFYEGYYLSINGSTGNVYEGKIKTVDAVLSEDFNKIMSWADEVRRLGVRTNADTVKDATVAANFGAEGIGLCRTEHMFFEADRIFAFRKMICSKTLMQREEALSKILPMQKNDFKGLFKAMGGKPVVIRLLDPPLHEFLPKEDDDIKQLARDMDMTYEELSARVNELHELNPMLGHRGCRLAVTYPEIAAMQTKAIIMAAIEAKQEDGLDITPEIMVPLAGSYLELKYVVDKIRETVNELFKENGIRIDYKVGTMIEIPRAALTSDQLAKVAEFYSFGTNDLTQMTYGFSRDDAGVYIKEYLEKGIFPKDPFATIDTEGVGQLVDMAVKKGKSVNPELHCGICGEQGGDPASIEFFDSVGLDYVSCSPYRVPIARLAAAQARIKNDKKNK
ncbi:pyruvate, phosphate dikinase [Anaerofustis stercorihominis]|uniref:pyruvate, phosphate dikinase n=1 Tax=Anaerofustis stercorihominis TaxID=214853 RepID=UPI00214C06D4|nr:pyruvate, phosphate dikinase [Anaerofustis stercorihominis]MCR2032338.1 pyruvate, phosphate dikinase [Anaerofustis stercorihominis]